MSFELHYDYVILVFALFVVPRLLQRFFIPSAITSLSIGVLCGPVLGLFENDQTVNLLAMFGIVSLFLFAGLEVEFQAIRSEKRVIAQHLLLSFISLIVLTFVVQDHFQIDFRPAALVSLAILTPSTGFILDSLSVFNFETSDEFWIKTKAIATELLALGTLFFTLQSITVKTLMISTSALVFLYLLLPLLFRFFVAVVFPHAPKSEFAFLLMVALLAALITKELGVYYLVGAFLVGLAAVQFRENHPEISSKKMLNGVELFSSFFIPFYFFNAGLGIRQSDLSVEALTLAVVIFLIITPIRVGSISLHRRITLKENFRRRLRIGLSMTPTLVFTLVLAQILRDQFDIAPTLFGALIIYAVLNTLLPSLYLRVPPPDFEEHHLPENRPLSQAAISERAAQNLFSKTDPGE